MHLGCMRAATGRKSIPRPALLRLDRRYTERNGGTERVELYDQEGDPLEYHNLARFPVRGDRPRDETAAASQNPPIPPGLPPNVGVGHFGERGAATMWCPLPI